MSSARAWSVNNIRCSEKIHRHLEMPKIDSIMSFLPEGIMTYLRVVNFEGRQKQVLLEVEQKWSHRMLYPILPENLTLFCFGKSHYFRSWHLSNTEVCQNYIWGQLLKLVLLEWSESKSDFKFGFSMLKNPPCKFLEQLG